MGLPTVKVVAATLETIHNISNVKDEVTKYKNHGMGDFFSLRPIDAHVLEIYEKTVGNSDAAQIVHAVSRACK